MKYCFIDSIVGKLLLAGDDKALTTLSFQDGEHPEVCQPDWKYDEAPFVEIVDQLRSYFTGKLKEFSVTLRPEGTQFQQKVWKQLLSIPYGQTASYGEIARKIGQPKASRAVGAANGKNPLSIVVPCHRVIGSGGRLVGYGGGLKIKQALLTLECRSAFV